MSNSEPPQADAEPGMLGRTDRILRQIVGAVLIGLALFSPWAAGLGAAVVTIMGVVGAVLVVTGMLKLCPLYKLLGICTA